MEPVPGEILTPHEYSSLKSLCEIRVEIARIQEKLTAQAYALELAKVETLRRLSELNHAHETARSKEIDFVSVVRFDDFAKENKVWRDSRQNQEWNYLTITRFDDYVKAQATWREGVMVSMAANSGKLGAYTGVFAAALAIAAILMRFVGK